MLIFIRIGVLGFVFRTSRSNLLAKVGVY